MKSMPGSLLDELLTKFSKLELLRVVPLPECKQLTSLSEDTLKRQYPELIRHISPRRVGISFADVLYIVHSSRKAA